MSLMSLMCLDKICAISKFCFQVNVPIYFYKHPVPKKVYFYLVYIESLYPHNKIEYGNAVL